MRKIVFQVPEEVTTKLQRLAVETESRQNVIAFMLNQDIILNNANFDLYQNEYKDFYLLYSQAKTRFQKEYVNPVLEQEHIDPNKASWALDFDTREVTLTVVDEK